MPCLACTREQGNFTPTLQHTAAAVSAAAQLSGECGGQEEAFGANGVGRTK